MGEETGGRADEKRWVASSFKRGLPVLFRFARASHVAQMFFRVLDPWPERLREIVVSKRVVPTREKEIAIV